MKNENNIPKKANKQSQNIQWLPILLIAWNIVDAGFHIAIDFIEPVRIAGNTVGVVAATIVLLGLAKTYAPHVLGLGAAVIVILNSTQPPFSGPIEVVVLTFIGVSVFLLLRWAQVKAASADAEAGLGSDDTDAPIYLRWWGALLVTLLGLAIIYLVGSQIDPPQYAFMSIEQTDTTADSSLPRELNGQSAEILSAFFGLDDGMPSWSGNLCPEAPGKDGMPVVLSTEIDLDTMQAGDFQVTTASGKIGSLACATLSPAVDVGELRTVLLVGDYGSATQDPPVRVEIVGNLHSIDNTVNFKGAEIMVTPLEPGPSLVFAEIVPQDEWRLGDKGSQGGTGCPAEGVQQIVRVAWAGGVVPENGDEPGDVERQLYTVTVETVDGATRDVIPFALGDLGDGDNNHKLCLDTDERVLSVSFPAGILVDPNDDLNPETTIQVTQ
jgi:hypothetical protein